jgi:hypothetical protein
MKREPLKKTQTSGREPISLHSIWSTVYNAVYFGDPPCRGLAYSLRTVSLHRTEFIWEQAWSGRTVQHRALAVLRGQTSVGAHPSRIRELCEEPR